MNGITVKEAAEKWGISIRYTQHLLAAGRIPEACKYGHSWVIPPDTPKPSDPRKNKSSSLSAPYYLPYLSVFANSDIISDNLTKFIENIPDKILQKQWKAELAYHKGDLNEAKNHLREIPSESPPAICAATFALIVSVSTNDYPLYTQNVSFLKTLQKNHEGSYISYLAESALATVAVSMFAPGLAPQWLKNGYFTNIPKESRPFSLYLYIKYLQSTGDYEKMLAVAQTTLTLYRSDNTLTIYLKLMCAAASINTGKNDLAETYLTDALKCGLRHGFIIPFAENTAALGKLMEKCLKQHYPEYFPTIIKKYEEIWKNWAIFHNKFTKKNLTLILSRRELRIAYMAARHIPYKQIAAEENISLGRLKNIIQEIYGKLSVGNRESLADLVMWEEKKRDLLL